MEKKISPLEALESIIDTFYDKNTEDIKIVRKALNDYLMVKQMNIAYRKVIANRDKFLGKHHVETLDELDEKLTALEIIKEKNVSVKRIKVCLKHCELTTLADYNNAFIQSEKLTQEEFDLLKEVLK